MTYKESFLRFMVDCGVLTFGEFTLKSGRKAPYFINAGNYHSGAQLMELGRYYAACIAEHNIPVETVFGPAYKGIPLAAFWCSCPCTPMRTRRKTGRGAGCGRHRCRYTRR